MSTTFTVTIKATSITVSNGMEAFQLLTPLINMLTYEDEFVEETKTLGFMYDEQTDTLFLHKGVDIKYLQRLLIDMEVKYDLYDPYREMDFEYDEIIAPRNDEQVDVINFIAGLQHHASNINASQLFIVKPPGFGKGHPCSTKLPSPDRECGYITIGDLCIGDNVFDAHGNPTKVTDIFDLGVTDVYKVTFNDGRVSFCTDEHLWQVRTGKNNPWRVMKLKDMIKDFKRSSTWKIENDRSDPYEYKYYIPRQKCVNYPKRDVPIDPWVVGCFIGNGCCTSKYLTISCPNDTIPSLIADICGFEVKRNPRNYNYTFYYEYGKPVKTEDFFEQLPEIMTYSQFKEIPELYLVNDVDTRMRLVQGLMDTDGSISSGKDLRYHVNYVSTSIKLLEQIKWLLWSFGYSGTIVDDGRHEKYTNGFCGIVVFRIPNQIKQNFFTVSYKKGIAIDANKHTQRDAFSGVLIKDISFSHREHCKCIKVDNLEHLYLTENFIVTHNTFCSGVGMCKYKTKTLIIMHRESLRNQWINSLYNMQGLSSKEVHEITTSEELYDIAHNQHGYDYDIYLMTHATFRAGLRRINNISDAMNITKNLGIGLKIIDEAHLEFRNTLMIDFVCNVKRNVYITATDGRSAKEENSIFRHVFANTLFYKPSGLLTNDMPKKWVEYYTVTLNTECKPNIYRYRVAGGRGMNPASYGKWVIAYDKKQRHFKCCRDLLKIVYKDDPHAKVLLFMPLIDLCSECAYFLTRSLNYDDTFDYDLDIRTINSQNSKADNERNKKADVIVTTIPSCGTGTDLPGITTIISCSPYVSGITCSQVFGRIRYCGKVCKYYDIVDESVLMDKIWLKSRRKKFARLALNVKDIRWEEDPADEEEKKE